MSAEVCVPSQFYRLVENRDPGPREFWPEGRLGALEPRGLDHLEQCLWECGTSVYETLEDAAELADALGKAFWVQIDLAGMSRAEVGIVKSGAKSHHELIAKPGRLRELVKAEGRIGRRSR